MPSRWSTARSTHGLHFADLEPALAAAALAHYNDFGHTLIYLMHVRRLIERLGAGVEKPLLLAWLRSLISRRARTCCPIFAATPMRSRRGPRRQAAAAAARCRAPTRSKGNRCATCSTRRVAAAGNAPLDLYFALMEAGARHLLRFDERHALRTDNSVADNVGWLDFTHALTFGHALREQCARQPELWPQGLLQLALFVGRNSGYLDATMSRGRRRSASGPSSDETAFHARAIATIVDHGHRAANLSRALAQDVERGARRSGRGVARRHARGACSRR